MQESTETNSGPSDVLKRRFGHDGFLPMQEEVIENVLSRRDSLVLMPTGSGKSICYQLPALLLDGLTLVVSPLIALMKDQVDALTSKGIRAAFINSAMTYSDVRRVQADAYHGRLDILYVAPERLVTQRFNDFLRASKLGLIAIDEAHCISEWGHDFRPDYRNLQTLRDEFPDTPMIALTATATERVREDILYQLRMTRAARFVASFNRPNLTYSVRPKRRTLEALADLLRRNEGGSAIVYCFSRQDTEDLASSLSSRGFSVLPYHAGLEDRVRRDTQERFLSDEVLVITATIAFGMGVDKPNIRLVVHYDLPKTIEGYYQETGRAGRDGLPSECVLFFSYRDKMKQDYFIDQIEDDAERANARAKLAKMIEYGSAKSCRRGFLLEYFGEEWREGNCGACDVCLAGEERSYEGSAFDGTETAQKVLSAVIRTGERFGAYHVVEVLLGRRSRRVLELGHDQLSVHGIARATPKDELNDVLDQLIDMGLIARETGAFPTLSVTPRGRDFLKDSHPVTLVKQAGSPSPQGDPVTIHNPALFEKLRVLRKELADALDAPPFVVFGDAVLRQMAWMMPRDHASLRRIKGIGATKARQFGDQFLAVITSHLAETGGEAEGSPEAPAEVNGTSGQACDSPNPGYPRQEPESDSYLDTARPPHSRAYEPWSPGEDQRLRDLFESGQSVDEIASALGRRPSAIGSRLRRSGLTPRNGRSDLLTLHLVREGLTIAEIAQRRGIAEQTVLTHLERLADEENGPDLAHFMPELQRYERIAQAFVEVSSEYLKPVKESLGDDYSFDELRLVRMRLRQVKKGNPHHFEVTPPDYHLSPRHLAS